jgi:hypothetical protein
MATLYKKVLQSKTDHSKSHHLEHGKRCATKQGGGHDWKDVIMEEAIGLVDTMAARLMGHGKMNPFKPMEGHVFPPSCQESQRSTYQRTSWGPLGKLVNGCGESKYWISPFTTSIILRSGIEWM